MTRYRNSSRPGCSPKIVRLPHTLYTVTAEGRTAATIEYTEGVADRHGEGDPGESSFHVLMAEVCRRYVEQEFVDDAASPVVDATAYYETDEHQYDVVGLDDDGTEVVGTEAERSNHDTRTAVPDAYDKMAALDPADAIWGVKNRDGAHDLMNALNELPESEPRGDKVSNQNTPPQ